MGAGREHGCIAILKEIIKKQKNSIFLIIGKRYWQEKDRK